MAKINHSTTLMINSEQRRTIKILGIKIDSLKLAQVLKKIEQMIEDGRKNSRYFQTVTVNPEFVMEAQKNLIFKEVLNGADLALADGAGILWAAKRAGRKIAEKIAGVDLVWKICQMAQEKNYKIFLLGAKEGVGDKAAQNLKKSFPKLKIVGTFAGSPDPKEAQAIIDLILEKKPDILFVALGAPKQEKWIHYNIDKIPSVKVAIGVGGAFDFISGKIQRAPNFLRKIGLEWLWRFMLQPWRAKRIYNAVIKFPCLVIRARITH